ncbi:baculoviral IAP repeat-containing protein 5.1-like [Ambystoma mexicanum]|uniref:baculoviral IAP repeat-containing protein 5.1-like n=1 Tax=Ambystoma mexicanum TaxID=8296 RepID=UPI0037E83D46
MMDLLHQYSEMYEYTNRLKTFVDWPFTENCSCTPENMAKAGFIHSPSQNEPDVARCFFCLKELEGWEPDDDPWNEHARRSATCGFLSMQKDHRALAMDEFLKLELERFKCYVHKKTQDTILHFEDELRCTTRSLHKYFENDHQCSVDVEL